MGGDRRQAPRGVLALAIAAAAGCSSSGSKGPGGPGADGKDAGLDPAEERQLGAIASAVNAYGPAVHTCWAMAAADDYRLEGTVLLRLEMGEAGAVAAVEVEGDEPGDEALTGCLRKLWRESQWPADLFAAGDEIRLPPLAFVAPEAGQFVVNARHARLYPVGADEKSGASILIDYRNSGNSAGGLSLLSLEPGFAAPLHRHSSAEVLYVLDGSATLGGARRQTLEPGTGAFIPPGAPHDLRVEAGGERAVVLQLFAPGGPEQGVKGVDVGSTARVDKVGAGDPRWLVRKGAEVAEHVIKGGKVRLLFDAENAPASASSLAELTLEPGARVPEHVHASSTEILFLIEGGGVMTIDGEPREVTRLDAIQIPAGVKHGFVAGEATVKAIQFYTPAGPEQRFKGK